MKLLISSMKPRQWTTALFLLSSAMMIAMVIFVGLLKREMQTLIDTTGPGPRGMAGLDGLHGPIGSQGSQGKTGLQGIAGPPGPTGAKSSVGPQGKTGKTGSTGKTGPKGDVGPTGLRGMDGKQGIEGSRGPEGMTFNPLTLFMPLSNVASGSAFVLRGSGLARNMSISLLDNNGKRWDMGGTHIDKYGVFDSTLILPVTVPKGKASIWIGDTGRWIESFPLRVN